MTTPTLDGLVQRYLTRLDAALEGIPERRRREMVTEVGARIDAARLELPADSEAGVRAILASVGSPEHLAAEEHSFHPWSSRRSRLRRGAAAVIALSLVAAGSVTAIASTRSTGNRAARVSVPDLVGRSEASAVSTLGAAHLAVGAIEEKRSSSVAAGAVVTERPVAGTPVRRGASVTLEISDGS